MIETKFKQTQVGQIPEDWKVKPVRDLGVLSKGKGISRSECGTGSIPCIRYGEIYTHHDNYVKKIYSYISPQVASTSQRLFGGELLFSASGETKEEIGKCIAFLGEQETYAGGDIIILTPAKDTFDSKFLGFVMNSKNVVMQKSQLGQGDAVVHITSNSLKSVIVPIPPLKEQQRIAEALSDVDALISSLGKMIEKKRNIKLATMQQLLTGKQRLPGFTEPWVDKKVKELFEITRGYVLAMNEVVSQNIGAYKYPVYSSQTTNNGLAGYYNKFLFENCITWTTDGANAGDVHYRKGKFYCTNVCGVLRNTDGFANECIASIINLISRNYVSYVGNPKLMNNVMAEIPIHIPPTVTEQRTIANILTDMDNEIATIEVRKKKYEALKQGMMQQLLTGKIRLI